MPSLYDLRTEDLQFTNAISAILRRPSRAGIYYFACAKHMDNICDQRLEPYPLYPKP